MIFDYFNLTTITKLNELLVSMDKKLDKILEKFSSGLDATTTCRSSSKTINKDDPKFVVSTKLEGNVIQICSYCIERWNISVKN